MLVVALQRSRRFLTALTAVTLVAISLAGLAGPVSAGSERQAGITRLGKIKLPQSKEFVTDNRIVHVDDARRLMYVIYIDIQKQGDFYLAEYSLRTAIPSLKRTVRVAAGNELPSSGGPYQIEVDTKRNRLILAALSNEGRNQLVIIDLRKLKVVDNWLLPTKLPGFLPFGVTYSRRDDRIYLIGEFSHSPAIGNSAPTFGRKAFGPGTSVVALHAASGDVAWVRPVPQCQQALNSLGVGALIARSERLHALYFACVTGGAGAGDAFPGQSGLARLWISPKATAQDAKDFRLEYFPVSGAYFNGGSETGVAGFDARSERFFLQSLSLSTPGAWVFDGLLSGWVGFVAAPDNTDTWLGLNARTGHYYMGSSGVAGDDKKGYLVATSGRSTPIPQGTVFRQVVDGFIATDSRTDRLFIRVNKDRGYSDLVVLRDDLPVGRDQHAPNYDDLTSALPEGPKTVTSFSGGVNGYGTRFVLVGGYQGGLNVAGQWLTVSQIRSADRGLTFARVPSVDLREAGAAASAQAVVPDSSTEAELKENGGGDWPWTTSSCLDGGGTKIEDGTSDKGGNTAVRCDLGRGEAGAESSFGAVSGEGFSIGSSAFSTRAVKDPKLGVVTETIAVARGIELSPPNGQSVSIGRVASVARTAAHGHPGTTKVLWERVLSGIEIRDEKGEVVNRVGECVSTAKEDRCKAITSQINDALGFKMRLELPQPDLIKTPKGAFAAVQQSDADFYHGRTAYSQGTSFSQEAESKAVPALQLVIFNDSVERSRLLVQLAAIQANSIYTITPREEVPAPKPITQLPQVDDVKTAAGVGSTSAPLDAGPVDGGNLGASEPVAAAPVSAPIDIPGVLAFLVRSPKEALLVAGIWLLFGGAGGAVVRRRLLVGVLGGNS